MPVPTLTPVGSPVTGKRKSGAKINHPTKERSEGPGLFGGAALFVRHEAIQPVQRPTAGVSDSNNHNSIGAAQVDYGILETRHQASPNLVGAE